ncbi:MAG: hypothetical protein P4M11_08925 [Candidatus Pacebacteria bacterium]|nr:hypothetical protein [Candidatus Paceibacterota bacterium]
MTTKTKPATLSTSVAATANENLLRPLLKSVLVILAESFKSEKHAYHNHRFVG